MDGKFMENLFQKMRNIHKKNVCMDVQYAQHMHGKSVPKDVNIETHVWKILFERCARFFKFLEASLQKHQNGVYFAFSKILDCSKQENSICLI